MKVFLGGTCNDSTWRDALIPMLTVDYFNPVVKDWTPSCQEEEIRQRETCDAVLYTITSDMAGVYSIAEVVDDSNKRPQKTILCLLLDGFNPAQAKSLQAAGALVMRNGGRLVFSLEDAASILNASKRAELDSGTENAILEVKVGPLVIVFTDAQDWINRAHTIWTEHHIDGSDVVIIDARGIIIASIIEPITYPVHVYQRRPVPAAKEAAE